MARILTLLFLIVCINCYTQLPYQRKKKKQRSKIEINTKITAITAGTVFVFAGTIAMKSRGDVPFADNGTKWKICPSEWAIIGGFTFFTFGVIYKF